MKKLGYVVLLLVVVSTSCLTPPKTKGFTARVSPDELFRAVITRNTADVMSLIEAGIDVNAQTEDGATALMLASQTGHFGITRMLIEAGADVNTQGGGGFTALMFASGQGHTSIVRMLIEAGADSNTKTNLGATALMYALGEGHTKVDVVRSLIEAGADVNVQIDGGFTALIITAEAGNVEAARMLIEAGADVNAQTDEGYTAFSIAYREGHTEISRLLTDAGAKPFPLPEPKFSFEQVLAGLWCNPEYDRYAETDMKPNLFPGKWIFGEMNNKVFVFPFDKSTDEDWNTDIPHWYEIDKQWIDDSGGIYFHLRWYWIVSFDKGYEYFILLRLGPDKDYYEFTLSSEQFPTDIDPNNASYHIYHRCSSESRSTNQ